MTTGCSPRLREHLVGARAVYAEQVHARAAQRIEDTEELMSWGRSLGEVAERAGFPSTAAAERYLRRHGRPDLARPFATAAWQSRKTQAA